MSLQHARLGASGWPVLTRLTPFAKTRSVRLDVIVGIAVALILAGPLWFHTYPPVSDGPSHASGAAALWDFLLTGKTLGRWSAIGTHFPIFRDYFALNRQINANFPDHLLLIALMRFTPAHVAVKLVLTLYIVLMVAAAWWSGRALGGGHGTWIVAIVAPFICNYLFYFGFLNFCLSVPVLLWMVAYALRHQRKLRGARLLTLTAAALVTFFLHVSTFIVASIVLCSIALVDALANAKRHRRQASRILAAALIPVVLALLPGVFLTWSFLFRTSLASGGRTSLLDRLLRLASIDVLVAYSPFERVVGVVLVVLLFLAIAAVFASRGARRSVRAGDGLLVAALLLCVLFLRAPEAMGGGYYVSHRLNLFPFLCLALWLAIRATPKIRAAGRVAGLGAVIVLTYLRLPIHAAADRVSALSAEIVAEVPEGSTLAILGEADVPRAISHLKSPSRAPLPWDALLYVLSDRHVVNLSNYEMQTGSFPLVYRTPWDVKGCAINSDESLDWWNPATGARVDFIIMALDTERDLPRLPDGLTAALSEYEPIRSNRMLVLYAKRGVFR